MRTVLNYVDELARMGSHIKVEGNVAVIDGVAGLTGAQVNAPDLRAGAATRRGEEHPPKYTPDFVKLAESYGAKGIRVTEKSEMKAAFEQAKANRALKVPTLIEFMLDPEVQVYPMVRPGGTLEDLLMD